MNTKTTTDFKPGQTVYLRNGRECVFVAKTESGYVVHGLLEDRETGESYNGEPFIASQVYSGEPKEIYGPEITRAADELAKVREQLQAERDSLKQFNAENSDRLARMKQHEQLRRLDDFLSGKITHYVVVDWTGPMIMTLEESRVKDEGWSRERPLRLLSLYGKSNGDLEWRLSRYSDGSGSSLEVFPMCSLDDAKSKLSALLETMAQEYRDKPKEKGSYPEKIVACAMRADLPPQEDIVKALKAQRIASAEYEVKKSSESAALAADKLKKLQEVQ